MEYSVKALLKTSSVLGVPWRWRVSVAPFQLLRSVASSWSKNVALRSMLTRLPACTYGVAYWAFTLVASRPLIVGASFTAVTAIDIVLVLLEIAELVPCWEVSSNMRDSADPSHVVVPAA